MSTLLDRRTVIAGLAATFASRAKASELRVAVIDWAMLETVLALGVTPVAATELIQFRDIAVEPVVPAEVADLGLRGVPNYELLRITAPDLILISNFYEPQRDKLERASPVLSFSIYLPGRAPFPPAADAMLKLGARLDRAAQAERAIATTYAELARSRQKVQRIRPVYLISFGDARHFRAFGDDSMFGDVLMRLGHRNAWRGGTSYSASAPVGIEELAREPEAIIVTIAPTPPEVARGLSSNALWNSLPAVKAGRVVSLAPINHFGALPAAQRFARLFAAGVSELGARAHD